jgi:hypothetical protein
LTFTSAPAACALADTVYSVYDFAFSPNGKTGYLAHITPDFEAQDADEYGRTMVLYKTTNAGDTWEKQNNLHLSAIKMVMDSTLN